MKRKVLTVLLTLVLVLSFSLVTAVPAGAQGITLSVTGDENDSVDYPGEVDQHFSTVTIDASLGVTLSGSVDLIGFEDAPLNTVWYEAGLVSEDACKTVQRLHNKGIYMIALYDGTDYKVHVQNVPGTTPAEGYFTITNPVFAFELTYHDVTVDSGQVDLRVTNDGVWTEPITYSYAETDVFDFYGAGYPDYDADDDLTNARIVSQIFTGGMLGATDGMTFTSIYDNIEVDVTPYTLAVPGVLNADTGQRYLYIQPAIDGASLNDTINVATGIYAEAISVGTDNLKLQSESKWGALIRPTTAAEAVVRIVADGVTVDGFVIDGTTLCTTGILGWETSGLTIKNNKIHGAVSAWHGCGILLFSWGNSGTVYDNLIEGNTVYDTGRMGIMICDYDGTNYTVTSGNTITGNTVFDVWKKATEWDDHGGGIQINVAKGCSINNNLVYNVQDGQRGIYMYGSAAGNTIEHNTLRNNPIGIQLWISGEGGSPPIVWGAETATSPQVHYNNICDNGIGAISSNIQGTPMVMNATNNWWGDASGPDGAQSSLLPGTGDSVSDKVKCKPWLTREFQTVLDDDIAYFGVSFPVKKGWNIVSAPLALDEHVAVAGIAGVYAANTWGGLLNLGKKAGGDALKLHYTGDVVKTYTPIWYYDSDPDSPDKGWRQATNLTKVNPLDAFYIRMMESDSFPVLFSPDLSVPSKKLYHGWNLVGCAYMDVMFGEEDGQPLETALATIEEVSSLAGDVTGYSQVVSPPLNQESWIFIPGTDGGTYIPSDVDEGVILMGKGYWVFMENPGTLAGLTFTPISLPE